MKPYALQPFLLLLCFLTSARANAQIESALPKTKRIRIMHTDTAKRSNLAVPINFATCQYGFFCRQELKLEKQTHIPVRFRLGSIEYNNWLEGKSRYRPQH